MASKFNPASAAASAANPGSQAPPADAAAGWIEVKCSAGDYRASIDRLRENLKADRQRGKACWVKVSPSQGAASLFLCLDRRSLYINAVRGKDAVWYKFSDAEGAVPSGCKTGQSGHYKQLRKPPQTNTQTIDKLIPAIVAAYDGTDVQPGVRTNLWTLVSLVSEAARFKSVCETMHGYVEKGWVKLDSLNAIVNAWEGATKDRSDDIALEWLE